MLQGLHCAPFVSLLGTFGASLGHLGKSWGTLWDTLGCIGASWGCSEGILGQHWRFGVHGGEPRALKYRACAQKQTRWNSPGGPGGPGGPGETVHELQFRTYLPHAPGIRMT